MRAVMVVAFLAAGPAAAQEPPSAPGPPVIVVSGEAVVQRAPDRAFVTVAVEARAKTPGDAQRQNAQAMTAVRQRLGQARLGADAVRTLGFGLEQEFDYVQNRREPRDFVARNSVEARVDDIARLGEILDAVVQAGATSIAGVRFDVRDRPAAEREALRLAVADARARADAAAAGAGRTVDRVIRIEDARDGPIITPRMMTMAVGGGAAAAPTTPIEPGTIEIRARVTLTVSMK